MNVDPSFQKHIKTFRIFAYVNLTQDQLHLNVVELETFDNWLKSLALACTTNKITTLNQVLAEKFNRRRKKVLKNKRISDKQTK